MLLIVLWRAGRGQNWLCPGGIYLISYLYIFYFSVLLSFRHFMFLSVYVFICLSVSLCVYLSCLSLCLFFDLSVSVLSTLVPPFCPSAKTHAAAKVGQSGLFFVGRFLWWYNQTNMETSNVLNQTTFSCNTIYFIFQQQKHLSLWKLCVMLITHVYKHLILQQRQNLCFGSAYIQSLLPSRVTKKFR